MSTAPSPLTYVPEGEVFTLQTLPDVGSDNPFSNFVGKTAGFSLHAGVATKANERAKLNSKYRSLVTPARRGKGTKGKAAQELV